MWKSLRKALVLFLDVRSIVNVCIQDLIGIYMNELMVQQASKKQELVCFTTMSLNNGIRSCAKLLMSSEAVMQTSG